MILFGDAIRPIHIPQKYAALYSADCAYPCPPGENKRWDTDHTRWITQNSDGNSSIMDFEEFTPCFDHPEMLTEWLDKRSVKSRPAWLYCDLENAEKAHHYASNSNNIHWYWWVATLDGVQRSAAELAALLTHWGALTSWQWIAAQQYEDMGEYDASLCFNAWL